MVVLSHHSTGRGRALRPEAPSSAVSENTSLSHITLATSYRNGRSRLLQVDAVVDELFRHPLPVRPEMTPLEVLAEFKIHVVTTAAVLLH